jgi:hypothetical protein
MFAIRESRTASLKKRFRPNPADAEPASGIRSPLEAIAGPASEKGPRGASDRSAAKEASRLGRDTTRAGEGTRTLDIQLGKLALYQLSYAREPLKLSRHFPHARGALGMRFSRPGWPLRRRGRLAWLLRLQQSTEEPASAWPTPERPCRCPRPTRRLLGSGRGRGLPRLRSIGRFRRGPLRSTASHLVDQPTHEIDHPIGLRRIGHLRSQPILELIDDLRGALLRRLRLGRGVCSFRQGPGVGSTGKLRRGRILGRGTIAP